jgi:hypothetical protein
LIDAFDSAPLGAGNGFHSVVACQCPVEEGVIRVEKVKDRAVVLNEVSDKSNDLLVHGFSEQSKLRVKGLVLVVVFVEISQMEPLTSKLNGEAPRSRIGKQSLYLPS